MSRNLPPQTPTRRSKRFQPLPTPSKSRTTQVNATWLSEPIYTRPTNPELDLLPDELQVNEDLKEEDLETVFYDSFQLINRKPKTYRRVKQDSGHGSQEFRVGDTVMIETSAISMVKRPPSVAVIVSMWETRPKKGKGNDEGSDSSKMRVRIHWFLRPSELASIRAKKEHEENEIYYSLSSCEILLPEAILSKCTVTSKPPKKVHSKPSRGSPSKVRGYIILSEDSGSDEDDLVISKPNEDETQFYCRFAINSYRGLYYDLDWDTHHAKCLRSSPPPEGDGDARWGSGVDWDVTPTNSRRDAKRKERASRDKDRPSPKKRIKRDDDRESDEESHIESEPSGTEDEFEADDDEDDDVDDDCVHASSDEEDVAPTDDNDNDELTKPPRTPSKRKRPATSTTPRKNKRTLVHPTPHSKARTKKDSGRTFRVPKPTGLSPQDLSLLPSDPWLRAMNVLHVGSRPDALPCRGDEFVRVLRCVGDLLEEGSGGCVYISGVPGTGKTATVHTVIRELQRMAEAGETNPFTYVEINGLKVSEPTAAYSLLWEAVMGHDATKNGHLKISAKESLKALTRHFSGGGGGRGRGPGGHACVVLMDELDQLVTAKQDVVYNFFNWPTLVGSKLVVIAVANTMDLPERVMTGRVRSRLGMIRINFQPYSTPQLLEIVKARLESAKEGLKEGDAKQEIIGNDALRFAAAKVSSVSGDARRILDICRRAVELVHAKKRAVKISDVNEVVNLMQKSPTAAYLRDCSLHERMMLASLVKCMKREGVEEIKWGEIQNQHLTYMNILTSDDDSKRKLTPYELNLVLESLAASHALVVEEGLAVSRKPEGEKRVLLNLEQSEVEKVLSEVGGARWKNILCG